MTRAFFLLAVCLLIAAGIVYGAVTFAAPPAPVEQAAPTEAVIVVTATFTAVPTLPPTMTPTPTPVTLCEEGRTVRWYWNGTLLHGNGGDACGGWSKP